jgi:two-component system response regulator YesN
MPLNIIIADDEYFIRQRIIKIIPREELDIHFIGEAENGLEVLELLNQHLIDLILLDIKMPRMNGIEVAESVYRNYPSTKIILLSGYNDFEYARSAMRFGVMDYLLKPVDASTLTAVLKDTKEKIELLKKQQKQIQKYYHFEKCTFLSNVLNGCQSIEQLTARYPEVSAYDYTLYLGAFIYEENEDFITELVAKIRHHGLDCEYFKELDYAYTIQFFLHKKEERQKLKEVLDHDIPKCSSYTFLALGDCIPLTEPWLPDYKKNLYALNHRYFNPESKLILTEELTWENRSADLSKVRQTILYYLNSKDPKGLEAYIKDLFQPLEETHDVKYLNLIVTEFFTTYHIHYGGQVEFSHNPAESASQIIDEEYRLSQVKSTILAYGRLCMTESETIPSDLSLSKKIIAYIDKHYSDPELTVNQLANLFQLNPSYMGSVFKKVNNESLLQYITMIRMEASKKLLESNQYKISDIAELVGYTDAFYYSKRFKKMFGYSPKDHLHRKK